MLLRLVDGERAVRGDGAVTSAVDGLVPVSEERFHVDPWVEGVEVALLVAVVALAVRELRRRRFRGVLFAALAAGATVAGTELAKALVSRPVIDGGGDGSFPSGTASWTLAACAVCVLMLDGGARRRAATLAAVLVLAPAVGVVWERWHYPTDVAGGWLLATTCVAAAWALVSEPEGGGGLLGQDPADGQGGGGAG